MRVAVLGAGILGVTSAWYLREAGHEVVVIDRRDAAGMETSFANGGQVSVCHAEPWANPSAPIKILKWLARDDAPLLFRLRMDPAQWSWGLRFLYECAPWRTRENIERILALCFYSRKVLQQLRRDTGIEYDHLARGILHFYTDAAEYRGAVEATAMMRAHGLDRAVKSVEEAVAIEPALAQVRAKMVGATFTPSDESGDALKFTQRLASLAAAKGVEFRYGCTITGLRAAHGAVHGVAVESRGPSPISGTDPGFSGNGACPRFSETITADAYVVALGSYSPLLTRPLGLWLPVYPAKGYSATLAITNPEAAPTVSLTDDGHKMVFSRLGGRLRLAGTAELSGYSTDLNPLRCESLVRRAREVFPDAADYAHPEFWTGLRPATPSNVPLVGKTRIGRLFLNTGHGTLGWTMGAGSGKAIADIISGRKPEVQLGSDT
jgi:D-amino-acid dehydrogenase